MQLDLIDWNGGEMPVEMGTPVLVLHRDGEVYITLAGEAYAEHWAHDVEDEDDGEIVGYKVVNSNVFLAAYFS